MIESMHSDKVYGKLRKAHPLEYKDKLNDQLIYNQLSHLSLRWIALTFFGKIECEKNRQKEYQKGQASLLSLKQYL